MIPEPFGWLLIGVALFLAGLAERLRVRAEQMTGCSVAWTKTAFYYQKKVEEQRKRDAVVAETAYAECKLSDIYCTCYDCMSAATGKDIAARIREDSEGL